MCTKKRSKHTPREIELPQGLQIIQAGESPLEYQDPERGSRSLTLAVVSGLDDAHVLKFPGDKVWPFSLQACAAAILVVSIVGAVKLFQSHINPSPIFFIVYGLAQIFSTVVILVMIYPSVTQLKQKARKDYNYWGIFSILLILLCCNLGVMACCIEFEVEVAKFNRSQGSEKRGHVLDYIDMMNGFGGAVLALVILHFILTLAYFISLTRAILRHRRNGRHCKPLKCSHNSDGILPVVAINSRQGSSLNRANNSRHGGLSKFRFGNPRNERPAARAHGRRHGTDGTTDNGLTGLEDYTPIPLPIPDRAHYSPSCREHPLRLNPVNPSNTIRTV